MRFFSNEKRKLILFCFNVKLVFELHFVLWGKLHVSAWRDQGTVYGLSFTDK